MNALHRLDRTDEPIECLLRDPIGLPSSIAAAADAVVTAGIGTAALNVAGGPAALDVAAGPAALDEASDSAWAGERRRCAKVWPGCYAPQARRLSAATRT